jgi:DNA-binding beta-propeller fold protein YncE
MKTHTRPLALAAAIAGLPLLAAGSLLPGSESSKRLELVQTISLQGKAGRLDHLALDGKGQRLFVANLSNNSLDIVDLKAGKLLKQIPGQGKIQGVAYAPHLDRIFVGNGEDGVCNAFDGKDYSLLKSVKLPDADNVRYDAKSARIYVTHAENALAVIDAKALKALSTVKLPGPPEAFQLDPTKPRIFLNCTSPSEVEVIDTKKGEVTASYRLERAKANYPLALDAENHRVFVGCRQPPVVLVLDAKTGKEVTRIDIPGDIDDLFHDAKRKRLYAICGEGFVAVIEQGDGERYKSVERIATAKKARTGLFDPETGLLYVVLPAHDDKGPEVQVYQAKP